MALAAIPAGSILARPEYNPKRGAKENDCLVQMKGERENQDAPPMARQASIFMLWISWVGMRRDELDCGA